MAIYYMDSKTFLKDFVKLNPKEVLKTQYIIVSNTIKNAGRYKSVISGNQLFPSAKLICALEDDNDLEEFNEEYTESLSASDPFFAVLIKGAIEKKFTIVFLCNTIEYKKLGYLKLIAKYVKRRFKYPMYCFKDLKDSGNPSPEKYDKEKVLKICNKVLRDAEAKQKKERMKTQSGRKDILSKMSKSEMIRELKSMDLYYKGMSKRDMKDALNVFFVEDNGDS